MVRSQTFPSTWAEASAWVDRQPSERKWILVGCGCCRLTWGFVRRRRYHQAVEASERYADGRLPLDRLRRRWALAWQYDPVVFGFWMVGLAAGPARAEHGWTCGCRRCRTDRAALDRRDGGSPPLPHDVWRELERGYVAVAADVFGQPSHSASGNTWRFTLPAVALATGIYTDRAFDRMPILADALEEAGCDDAEILAHCRGDGPHVRGCWVVDLVLGKG